MSGGVYIHIYIAYIAYKADWYVERMYTYESQKVLQKNKTIKIRIHTSQKNIRESCNKYATREEYEATHNRLEKWQTYISSLLDMKWNY